MQRTEPRCIICVLSAWDRGRVISEGGGTRRKEGEEEGRKKKKRTRGKERRGRKEKKKMSRESDHAPRLGKLVDSEVPSTEGRDY